MEPTGRWQRSTPWLRVWPAAVLVVALHAVLLHGWLLAAGLQRLEPLSPSIAVRILAAPSPAPLPGGHRAAARAGVAIAGRGRHAGAACGAARAAGGHAQVGISASRPAVPGRPCRPPPDYLGSSRLDPGPQLLEDVEPVYPAEAGLSEGTVVLRLLIGRSGAVDEVTVVRSSPKGVFDRSAVAAFSAARFSPGKVLGVAVKSQLTIEVHFTPVDRGANVSAPTY